MLAKRSAPQPAESSEPSFEEKALAFAQDSWEFLFVRNQTRTLIVLGVLVLGIALWGYQRFASARSEGKAQEQLGRAFLALEAGGTDSARGILETVSAEHKGLAASKAALLLGDMMLSKGDLAGAETQFQHARDEGKGLPLLEGGALRGLAAVQIEQKKYAEAEATLKDILSRYQKADGDSKTRGTEDEKHDLHPFLSQTMWQLALVQRKLGREADAAATAEKLVRLYPQSEEARSAGRLLAQLGKSADA